MTKTTRRLVICAAVVVGVIYVLFVPPALVDLGSFGAKVLELAAWWTLSATMMLSWHSANRKHPHNVPRSQRRLYTVIAWIAIVAVTMLIVFFG